MTLLAAGLVWELNYVTARREAIFEIETHGGGVWLADDLASEFAFPPSVPFWRSWMGDVAVAQLVLPVDYLGHTENNKRVTALFPETARRERPPFDVIGKLSAEDLREIWTAAIAYCKKNDIKEQLLGVEIDKKGEVEVTFGEIRGPLDGGGTILDMRKKNGTWTVVSRGSWVS
ncbi:MAG TPA: hypothetical protein VHD36_04025 [Pirellulales bacterium]|nr:hypothetical protein [Pirellulales bacterium]